VTLNQYLLKNKIRKAWMARMLDCTVGSLHHYLNGERLPRLDLAVKIQILTKGEVTCKDLLSHYESVKYGKVEQIENDEDLL